MALKFQTKTTLATSQSAVDGVSVRTPIHSTQPNYTVNLKAADGACTWQQEHVWLSSSSAQEVNMLQKCATCQQLCFCCWTAHIGGGGERKKNLAGAFFPWYYFGFRGTRNKLLWEVKVWLCDGVKVLKLGVWCCYEAITCENKSSVQKNANIFHFYRYLNFESTFFGVQVELWSGILLCLCPCSWRVTSTVSTQH